LIAKLPVKPFIIIHTIKTPGKEIQKLMEQNPSILLVVNGDFEDFFYKFFHKKIEITDISNIYYRNDEGQLIVNSDTGVKADLNDFILPAYASKHYTHFPKNKDFIISMIDEDNEQTDDSIYYRQSKKKFVE
jgi:hypothetical protein